MEKQFIPITPIGVEKEALKMTVLNGQPEIFHSIQGEGRNLGQDVVFCRLSECSLACSWCDSPQSWCYTQSKANQHEDGVVYDRAENQTQVSIDDLAESVKSYDEPHIVITGGEPLLQQRVLPAFIKKLRNENPDFYVEIETNGTIRPNDEMAELVNQWNVSPKLSNSGDSDFKFVVSSEQDVEEILTLLDEYEVPADRVFLMPLGRTREELAETEPLVKELAQTLNMNFSTREHINRWGDKRGV